MLAKKTSKNQITLPKDVVKEFPDTDYFDVNVKDNTIFLVPVKITPVGSALAKVRRKVKKRGISVQDVDDAIKWARKK